jgi:prepilin-type processing-associated H-X9-DG protein
MGAQVGIYAFNTPCNPFDDTDGCNDPCCDGGLDYDRQDYDNEVYHCPTQPNWIDERNYGYGYNHQFLGNARQTSERFHNFPVMTSQIKKLSGTVLIGDSMGTAAGVVPSARLGYSNDGPNHYANLGNHGWSLDPPRLTELCDRGSGDLDSPRTAVDPRHKGKANVVFADAHGATMTPYELGYRFTQSKRYADADPAEQDGGGDPGPDPTASAGGSAFGGSIGQGGRPPALQPDGPGRDLANNRYFSGTGLDNDPPPLPEQD